MNKKILKFSAIALSMMLLAGCGKSESSKTDGTEGVSTATEDSNGSGNQDSETSKEMADAFNEYMEILQSPEKMKFEFEGEIKGYEYTIVKLKDYKVPVLLVGRHVAGGITEIKVAYYDGGINYVDGDMTIGVASHGGFRGDLAADKNGDGFLLTSISSGTGDGSVEKYTIDDGKLSSEEIAEVKQDNIPEDTKKLYEKINWYNTYDLSLLMKKVNPGVMRSKAIIDNKLEDAKKSGSQIFEGTLKILDREQLLEEQGEKDPNPGTGKDYEKYAVLVLNKPEEATFKNISGEDYSKEVKMISLGDSLSGSLPDGLETLNGKKVIIATNSDDGSWPTDTSLPLGEPFARPEFLVEK